MRLLIAMISLLHVTKSRVHHKALIKYYGTWTYPFSSSTLVFMHYTLIVYKTSVWLSQRRKLILTETINKQHNTWTKAFHLKPSESLLFNVDELWYVCPFMLFSGFINYVLKRSSFSFFLYFVRSLLNRQRMMSCVSQLLKSITDKICIRVAEHARVRDSLLCNIH